MATRLAIPKPQLSLPSPPDPRADTGAPQAHVDFLKQLNEFSKTALEGNTKNLSKSMGFIDDSFNWLRWAYAAILTVGLLALIAAVIKGLGADTGAEAAAAGLIGGVSIGALLSSMVLKPTESMERNAVLVPWMLLVLNTYWTRLVYMNDPKKIDKQLEDAAKDAAAQFKAIAETHAKALGVEKERLIALAAPPPAEDEEDDAAGGDGETGGADGDDPAAGNGAGGGGEPPPPA